MKHRVLVADPAWPFKDRLPGPNRGAAKNYGLMTIDDICAFKLPELEDDAVLLLWRVSSMVEEAYRVVRAWGFVPKSEIVWLKRTTTGKRHFGMGRQVRAEHESVVIATRGRVEPRLKNVRSTFEAPIGEHSEKPEAFYDIIESMYPGPYAELFARRHRPGWWCEGNELPVWPLAATIEGAAAE